MEENTKKYFEKFKNSNHQINFNDLKNAEETATNLGKHSNDFLLILRMIRDVFYGNFKLNPVDLATIVALIVYVISPVDAIPDFIPIVGFIDDISLIGYILVKYKNILEDYQSNLDNKYLGKYWNVYRNLYVPT